MKMFKNIVRLLILACFSLSLTPLTTAQADAIQVQNETSFQSPIAYSANANLVDTGTDDGTVTGNAGDSEGPTSNVSVNVLSGILTLEAVPDFNFGSMMVGSTGKLKGNTVDTTGFKVDDGSSNPYTAGRDGNDTGLLEVIDSRNTTTKMPGFTLSASLGPLNPTEANSGDASINAILHLNPSELLNDNNETIATSADKLMTEKAAIDSKAGNTAAVMSLTPGSYNGGVIKANFNTPDSASLEIPGNGDNTKTSVKHMNAVVTWTLNAAPAVTTN